MNDIENKPTEEKKKSTFSKVTSGIANAVGRVQQGAKSISEKRKNDAYSKRLEKYRPVDIELFNSQNFYMPNLLIIEDDCRRCEVDVLEKAEGWLTSEKNVEIFHLFEDSKILNDLKFLPNLQCGSLYYMDNFDNKCFVKVDSIFSRARDERIAELKHVAHALGAKMCSIEIAERSYDRKSAEKQSKVGKEGLSCSVTSEVGKYSSGRSVSVFEGSDNPKKPELKWFANDENIRRLIESRCDGTNYIKSEIIELKGATSAVMSQKTACSIDLAMVKAGGKASMEKQAVVENESVLIFSIEF